MQSQEVRWIQRANSFEKAFGRLRAAVKLAEQRELSDLEAQGLIQGFEYTHELAWKTLKNFLEAQGIVNLYGSRDTTRTAFRNGLIENSEVWMDNGSDIDLTLRGGDALTHIILSRIANDLDDQLLPYTIDLSIFENIRNSEMVEQIKRAGVVFYKRQDFSP